MKNYDIGIIGAGVAGAFSALRLAEHHKKSKIILFELGRPPQKRRRFLEGWFGCFPTGDGKIYTNDLGKILDIVDGRRAKPLSKWFYKKLEEINPAKPIKTKLPDAGLIKKITDAGFEIEKLNYAQWCPDSIHQLSKIVAERLEDSGNIDFSFDNEVYNFYKKNKGFILSTSEGDFKCKKIILCAGRTGWRWVNKLYRDLGILVRDDIAKYGITIEIPGQYMKNFNKSHCILRREDLEIGPFSWNGSIIQEDHANLTIAAFRSNENRWKTDKVFFPLIGKKHFPDEGCKQTDRLSRLAFLLFGDRVGREKIKYIMKCDSQLNLIPEYQWLKNTLEEINEIIPALISRGYYHCPSIETNLSEIRVGTNLSTEINGLYVAGESAGFVGLAAAGISGAIAAESAVK